MNPAKDKDPYIKELFNWVYKLNDMDRILLNRIEHLESIIERKADEKQSDNN